MTKKFSWVDVLIVVAIVICVIGAYMRFFGRTEGTVVSGTEFVYDVTVRGVRHFHVEVLPDAVGTKFVTTEKGRSDEFGILQSYDVKPAQAVLRCADGTIKVAEVPERYDLVLTFKLNGRVNDNGYYTPQLKNIGVGQELAFKSKWIAAMGEVSEVKSN